jgi:prolyl-tRNA synthetase
MRGVPVRLEIGPRDIARRQVVLARRTGGEKEAVSEDGLIDTMERILGEVQATLLDRARRFLEEHIVDAQSVDEIAALIEGRRGFVRVGWCESQSCENTIRERTGASPRVIPLDDQPQGTCIVCGQPSKATVYYARAY